MKRFCIAALGLAFAVAALRVTGENTTATHRGNLAFVNNRNTGYAPDTATAGTAAFGRDTALRTRDTAFFAFADTAASRYNNDTARLGKDTAALALRADTGSLRPDTVAYALNSDTATYCYTHPSLLLAAR